MFAFLAWPGQTGRENFCGLKSLIVAVACGLIPAVIQAEEPQAPLLKAPRIDDWKIQIIPGPAIGPSPVPKAVMAAREAAKNTPELPKPATTDPASGVITAGADSSMPAGLTPAAYAEVYNSIPFRRSEYLANPNYRHEATIELLLGQVRPKTVTTAVSPPATCCRPQPVSYVGFFNPWGAKNSYYHYSYSRPTSYWLW